MGTTAINPEPTYTIDQIQNALNTAADAIIDAAELGSDQRMIDTLNLLVNAAIELALNPGASLSDITKNYAAPGRDALHPNDVLGWIK